MDSITSAIYEPRNVNLFHISSIKHRILIYVQDDFTSNIEIHKKTFRMKTLQLHTYIGESIIKKNGRN